MLPTEAVAEGIVISPRNRYRQGKERAGQPTLARVEESLGLMVTPSTDITSDLKEAKIKHVDALRCLRNSSREEAKLLVAKLDLLTPAEQKLVTLDHLLASAGVDPSTTISIVVEEMHRRGANISTLLMAASHPQVTEATIAFAQSPEGFADRNLLHRSMNTTPTPKNTVTNVTMRDIKQTTINGIGGIGSLSDLIKEVDSVLG